MSLKDLNTDKSWTLFLDRDGVINKKLENDYVKTVDEFEFLPGSKDALADLKSLFGRIVLVTNQQGIGKGLMSISDLQHVHNHMLKELKKTGGGLDAIYYCPELAGENPRCRKPNTGMAEQAREDFPEINFNKSIVVGDSITDMQFGKRLGMKTVLITDAKEKAEEPDVDFFFPGLLEFSKALKQ